MIWTLWESRLLDLDALGAQIAGSGRSGSPDCWTWTLWESRLLDLDALGVKIAGSGRTIVESSVKLDLPEELNEGWNKVARRAKQYMQSGKSFAEREKFCRAGKAVPEELDLTRD